MTNGLKINGGDKIGKTIIFAQSHERAVQIVDRFNKLYKYLGPDFCVLVDSQTDGSQTNIERFEVRDHLPQICVSVDMMDTGIDVPDVLNLVFFKFVKSKIKFLQMIGRGTRLSENIFGAGMNKMGFLIFDYFSNFKYFNNKGNATVGTGHSISQTIYSKRVSILGNLELKPKLEHFEEYYRNELKQYFVGIMNSLNNENIGVQSNMAFVNKYRNEDMWDNLRMDIEDEINERIIPILPPISDHYKIKCFDLIMLHIEDIYILKIANLDSLRYGRGYAKDEITKRVKELLKFKTIPEVMKQKQLLTDMIDAKYIFDNPSLEKFEDVRKSLRELMVYLPEKKEYYIVEIGDEIIINGSVNIEPLKKSYVERVNEYLATTKEPVFSKIANLDDLTQDEKDQIYSIFNSEIGTEEECAYWCNGIPLLQRVRMEVGISDAAILVKFGSFLNLSVLTQEQLEFMNQVINYVKMNGDMTFKLITQVSPFCDMDITQKFGTNSIYLKDLINGLHQPIK